MQSGSKMNQQWLLLIAVFSTYNTEEINLNFFQNDYDIKMDIMECSWHNKSYYKHVEIGLVWRNRTQRAISTKFELAVDLGNKVIIEAQLYKMMSNEYRFFPFTVRMSGCAEYDKNSFGLKDVLTKFSNINPCDIRKNTHYAINNLIPDFSKFPPRMPRGLYKLTFQYVFQSDIVSITDLYLRIIDKPDAWKKLPKSNRT